MQSLSNARIHFNAQGTPVASDFDDIYFSNDDGLAETDYVFLQNNGLPDRWLDHQHAYFHILETGFGTGANFLLCWQRFAEYRAQHPGAACQRLYFSSFEKFPLSLADLTQALAVHSKLGKHCQQLLKAYPAAVAGCHRLVFDDGHVILDLWQGDVNELLPQVPDQNQVDAIFLDGFAPAKNPDMWQESLFNQLFRLSKPHTTLATFTCAGLVKRGLLNAGFSIKKIKGYGRKREMLIANLAATSATKSASQKSISDEPIVIIGGGLAALCTAYTLISKGLKVTLVCADAAVAQGASHNRQGALYPNLPVQQTLVGQWHCQAFHFARQFYQQCQAQHIDFPMAFCGLLHLATTPQLVERQQKMALKQSWPSDLVRFVDAETASALAGIPLTHHGIYIEQAGWLSPQAFCQAIYQYLAQQADFTAHFNCAITAIRANEAYWQVQSTAKQFLAQHVVVATGADLTHLPPLALLPVNRVRGQVSHLQSSKLAALKTVICHKGYLTPSWQNIHCAGATFERDAAVAEVTAADNVLNVSVLEQQLNSKTWLDDLQVVSAKAAFRATLPDHLPLAGELTQTPGLWVHAGLGARGLLFAPLIAEILAAELTHEPLPLTDNTLSMLSPERFNRKSV